MKDLKASLDKFNEVTEKVDTLIKNRKGNKNLKVDYILLEENKILKNKNANNLNKLEKILLKINTIIESK